MSNFVDDALSGMAKIGAPRVPVGNSLPTEFKNATGTPTTSTVPRKNTQGGDLSGPTGNTKNVMVDRLGAQYGITARVSAAAPIEASATQANGRIVGPCTVRGGFKQESGGW